VSYETKLTSGNGADRNQSAMKEVTIKTATDLCSEVGSRPLNSILMRNAEADELVPVSVNVSPVSSMRTSVLEQ
jgi:hypothetical protein